MVLLYGIILLALVKEETMENAVYKRAQDSNFDNDDYLSRHKYLKSHKRIAVAAVHADADSQHEDGTDQHDEGAGFAPLSLIVPTATDDASRTAPYYTKTPRDAEVDGPITDDDFADMLSALRKSSSTPVRSPYSDQYPEWYGISDQDILDIERYLVQLQQGSFSPI